MNNFISRRQLVIGGTGAVVGANFSQVSFAQTRKLIVAVSSATAEPGTATQTSIPFETGFWKQEGLDVELKFVRGSALGAQLVMTNQADVVHAGTSTGLMAPAAKGGSLVAFYNMITQNFQMPAVPDDSPIKTLRDLKGKKLGVIGLATATIPIVKAVLEDAGLDPERDVTFIDVGYGAQAAAALWLTKQVDALAMYDSVYASIENVNPAKYKLRILKSPLSDRISFQTALIAKPETLKTKRDMLVAFAKGQAKASIFAMENPEMAARIHFKRYPEQKPTAPDEATAIQLGKNALLSRLTNMRIDNMAIKRDKWGYMDRSDVEVYLDILKKIGEIDKGLNPAILYTNELIDDINRFDIAAVKKIAREFKI